MPTGDADSTPPNTSVPLDGRKHLLAEWTRDGADDFDNVLALARAELWRGHVELWPALLDYFHGILDRKVDNLLLQVLDIGVSDEIKVRTLVILGHHLFGEAWMLSFEINGRKGTLKSGRGGWSPREWGPLLREGEFVTVLDVYLIRDRLASLARDAGESERVRQHARELLAFIAMKDATMWGRRRRVRNLRADFNHFGKEERMRVSARYRETMEALVAEKRKILEEEKARTVGIDANSSDHRHSPTALPQQTQRIPSSGGSAWPYLVAGLAAGLAVGAAGAWLLLRRRSGG